MDEILSELRAILGRVRPDLDLSSLPAASSLENAGIDSLDQANLLLEAQDTFDVTFPDEDLSDLMTLQAIAEFIQTNRAA
ncbi:acyl carrier protein [Novispirillum sp. DQ9]|uniref:acyl carrier protein n=1 Tax=Novispirillum sp. DQ9 TaxID=3398612 RepID=UPI003C7B7653